jgi:dihydropteroate synthase type 2
MTTILGILNITADSFSDGGKYLAPDAAIAHAGSLAADGADVIDIGAASSNPDAESVPPDVEIARLAAVLPALNGRSLSIDSYAPEVQRWALEQGGVDYLNDIHGFPDPAVYPALAASRCKVIVMHAVQDAGRATRIDVPPDKIMERITAFFDARLAALDAAGIGRERLILDPGMGFFLGSDPQTSLTVLRRLPELTTRYALPLLVSVSRKSFLRRITGRDAVNAGPASLAAELYAIRQGAAYIRTHAPGPLRDALAVGTALESCNFR